MTKKPKERAVMEVKADGPEQPQGSAREFAKKFMKNRGIEPRINGLNIEELLETFYLEFVRSQGAAAPSLPSAPCQLIYGDKETWCGKYTRNGEANSGMNLGAWYSAAVFWRNKAEGIPNPGELCPKCGWGMLIRQDGETVCHGGGCVAALRSKERD